jgi:hypothetical protein
MTFINFMALFDIGPVDRPRFIPDRKPVDPPAGRPEMSDIFSAPDGKLWRHYSSFDLREEINGSR